MRHPHRHGPRRWRMWRSTRRLQSRLYLWFLVAIGVAFGVHAVSLWMQAREREESAPPAMHVATRTIATRAAKEWDDPAALDAYLAHVRDTVGLDMHVRRDVGAIPRAKSLRNGNTAFDGHGAAFVPVMKDGQLVGALEFEAGRPPHRPPWFLAVLAAFVVLGVGARAVSRRLALPLEDVADAAERFGAGDFEARTRVATHGRHFVADEVREVAQAFDQMAERIARVVRDQRELLAAISHELRSPLGRARVALEIARDRAPQAAPTLDDIDRQLTDVDAILGDLLAAARAGLTDLKHEPTPLVPWLRARLASEPAPPAYHLVCESIADDVAVPLDAPLMNCALHDLLANAVAHGHPPSEPVEVRVAADDARATIAVRDRGPGFTPDVLAKAFEPFVKGDAARTPRRDGGGYGLGLALVRRIVEAHGGRTFARNVPAGEGGEPGGAEVGFDLPRATPGARKMV